IKDNRLKAYAVTTPERSDSLPGVPTLQEAGLEGYDAMGWFGIAAPAGTPEPIVKRLNEAITAALKDPTVVERINAVGASSSPTTPEEFRQLIENDIEKWGTIINRLNLHID